MQLYLSILLLDMRIFSLMIKYLVFVEPVLFRGKVVNHYTFLSPTINRFCLTFLTVGH